MIANASLLPDSKGLLMQNEDIMSNTTVDVTEEVSDSPSGISRCTVLRRQTLINVLL